MTAKVCHSLIIFCGFLLLILFPFQSHANSFNSKEEESSPFTFIKSLHGFKKGDQNIKGLNKLKNYLHHFGYLKEARQMTDDFDDVLELAVKTYQLNFRINVTGILDGETVSMMMLPRCGVPDIINNTNWMRLDHVLPSLANVAVKDISVRHVRNGVIFVPDRMTIDHHSSHLQTASHYAFTEGNRKWHKLRLSYALKHATRRDAIRPIRLGFKRWASVSRLVFRRGQSFRTANLRVSFEHRNHGDGHPFDGPGGVLAHAYAPTDGRLHFDADENWCVGAIPGRFDIGTVVLHEIGHLLGLGHSSDPSSIMYPSTSAGVTKDLNSDDIKGIKALYGL